MKNSIELKEMRSDIIETLEGIKDLATKEERDLTQDENNQVDGLLTEVDELDTKIERAEKLETVKREAAVFSASTPTKKDKDLDKFTFQGAMRAAYTGRMDGIIKEMDQEARSQARYTGQTFKGVGIPSSVLTRAWATASTNSESTMSFTDQLESNLVLTSAGANFYAGINDLKFPVFSGVASSWVAETGGSAVSSAGNLSAVTLTPKKLISVVSMSQESVVQNPSLEAALQGNIAANMAASLEQALLLSASDESNGPESIFRDAAAGSTAAFTGATASTLENTYIGNDGTFEGARMAFLMDSDAYAAIKVSEMVSNISAAYDMRDKTVNGYYSFVSSNVATDGGAGKEHVLFGDFSKVHIAQFGGLDFLFDPYTNAAKGEPRMVVTGLFDGDAVQNATAFANLIEA